MSKGRTYTLKQREAGQGKYEIPRSRSESDFWRAEEVYLSICRRDSGVMEDKELYERTKKQREQLEERSQEVPKQLESVGVKAFEETKLHIVGLISMKAEPIVAYRNIVFIPLVAARKRRKVLLQLEYYMWKNKHCRMWVFTTGQRTPIVDVREGITKLHRRLSRLNIQAFMKVAGVQIVFRSTELGSIEKSEDEATCHLHTHTVVKLSRKLTKDEWSNLLKRVRKWWKVHFSDSKEVHSAREACKYCVKPSDLSALCPDELTCLYEETFGLHLVQCLGELKEQRRDFKEAGTMPRKEGARWVVVPNWNSGRGEPQITPKRSNSLVCRLAPAAYVGRMKEPAASILIVRTICVHHRFFELLAKFCGSQLFLGR